MAEAHPWPEYIHQFFDSAILTDPSGIHEAVFYGPFTRLLYTLFSLGGQFEVVPLFISPALQGMQESIDLVAVFVVEFNRHPVFFIEIKPPATLRLDSNREAADLQMRNRFKDLRENMAIPTLNGVSAFGTRLSYEYDSATRVLRPECIQPSFESLTDVAPIHRWDCDVLQNDGRIV